MGPIQKIETLHRMSYECSLTPDQKIVVTRAKVGATMLKDGTCEPVYEYTAAVVTNFPNGTQLTNRGQYSESGAAEREYKKLESEYSASK